MKNIAKKKKSWTNHKKKKPGPGLLEQRKKVRKSIRVVIDIYNVKVHFDSLYNAGVKHSLSVYTLKQICVVGYLRQVLADILCVKRLCDHVFT